MTGKQFYRDGIRIRFSKGHRFTFLAFDVYEADKLVDLLNDLLAYKLLVRKHKNDIEQIYGKSIKKQLEEVMKE